MKPPVLILHATGTNRDREALRACSLAGGAPEIVHVNQLLSGEKKLMDYRMMVVPGGFSYGDDLGAGKLWSVVLRYRQSGELAEFVEAGRPILGICNGFQTLVKLGLLPGLNGAAGVGEQVATLTRNDSAKFECRWVYLAPQAKCPSVFTRELSEPIYCPVAHAEGKFVARDASLLAEIEERNLVALRYVGPDGKPGGYPWNPNGSQGDIAGICSPDGTVMGMMPHPEDAVVVEQHPAYQKRGTGDMLGLPLFAGGIRYASEL